MQFYPKARQQRPSIHDPSVRPRRVGVLKAATVNLLVLQILFLGLFCYIFGSLFQQSGHIHNINVLFVDYDGGAIGDAARTAYQKLKAPHFPTFMEQSASVYPHPSSIEGAVCDIKYWGALFITANASNALSAAFAGGPAASSYNKNDVLTMVWNEARYPTVVDAVLADSMKLFSETARVAYSQTNGNQSLQSINSSDSAALAALYEPWTLANNDIQPTSQGSRVIYNTLVIILILIQEFFYLGTINALYAQFKLYTSVSPHRIAIVRLIMSSIYTLLGSMCTAGAIWAFRSGWDVNGNQFALTWLVLWLFAHLNFLVLDVFTIWLPLPFVPMALISWIITNITAVLLPFELSPAFYRVGFALPAHSVFQVLIDIWSSGCNPKLYYALPVLFVYEVLGIVLSTIGVYRRAHYACINQEMEEKACQEQVSATLHEGKEAQLVRRKTAHDAQDSATSDSGNEEGDSMSQQRQDTATTLRNHDQTEIANIIHREMSRPRVERTSRDSTGPSFALAYTD
ncbi:hypothetical protein N7491_008016 [Penicillium cf. griseofulvum]|uniref:DUF3533 domain-containing protein n=1 Tax=Penicillium cf. griseofulvum TaxID=2972120 RepID=A0A9W9J3J0_9EURO|nr:hypothetical protein N7472_008957 [Penicillium cf. griseofulvum]KAJ5427574.1 hypothetical protein N7491_008016 [Penicillium cf. griseofulvum]KAJ5431771.1 hypothetical protein N7445_008269 [Penicillium cf. griseofulvum]